MTVPQRVTVVEVGPRDGLQNEAATLSVDDRVAFCDALLDGRACRVVEVGAFVSPKWVPQMAGSDEVFQRVQRRARTRGCRCSCPTARASSAAREAGAREIAVFTAASETFNRKNINAVIDESFAALRGVRARGARERRSGCAATSPPASAAPTKGAVEPAKVVEVARRLVDAGCDEVSIGDTIGVAVPTQVADVMGRLRGRAVPRERSPCTSTTRGAPRWPTCWPRCRSGIAIVDSSAGGLGGCPYAPGASGNLATEDLLYMLHGMGIETGVDLEEVVAASRALAPRLGRALPSRYLQARAAAPPGVR